MVSKFSLVGREVFGTVSTKMIKLKQTEFMQNFVARTAVEQKGKFSIENQGH